MKNLEIPGWICNRFHFDISRRVVGVNLDGVSCRVSFFFSLRKHLYMLWALNRTPKMQPILLGKQIFVESREAEGDPTGTNDFRREPKTATQLVAVYVPWRFGEEKGTKMLGRWKGWGGLHFLKVFVVVTSSHDDVLIDKEWDASVLAMMDNMEERSSVIDPLYSTGCCFPCDPESFLKTSHFEVTKSEHFPQLVLPLPYFGLSFSVILRPVTIDEDTLSEEAGFLKRKIYS